MGKETAKAPARRKSASLAEIPWQFLGLGGPIVKGIKVKSWKYDGEGKKGRLWGIFRKAERGGRMAWCSVVCGSGVVDMVGVRRVCVVGVLGWSSGAGARADSASCTSLESTRTGAWTERLGGTQTTRRVQVAIIQIAGQKGD